MNITKCCFWRGSYDFLYVGVLLTKEKVIHTTGPAGDRRAREIVLKTKLRWYRRRGSVGAVVVVKVQLLPYDKPLTWPMQALKCRIQSKLLVIRS